MEVRAFKGIVWSLEKASCCRVAGERSRTFDAEAILSFVSDESIPLSSVWMAFGVIASKRRSACDFIALTPSLVGSVARI